MGLFDQSAQKVFSIPAGAPFLDVLARELVRGLEDDPFALIDTEVWVPGRRAGRALGEAIGRALGTEAALLPAIRALGDLDEPGVLVGMEGALDVAPAIGNLQRRFLLVTLIRQLDSASGRPERGLPSAIAAADALARLLDESGRHGGIDWSTLDRAMEEDQVAEHFAVSQRFLGILGPAWRTILDDLGVCDTGDRLHRLVEATAARVRTATNRIVIAGSTGADVETRVLMRAVLEAPNGRLVFQGVEAAMAEATRSALAPSHPQYVLSSTLRDLKIAHAQVQTLGNAAEAEARTRLLALALAPPEDTSDWVAKAPQIATDEAANGLTILATDTPDEEARVIALMLRETLETPDRTAALVTPDEGLAFRVSAVLRRWGIAAPPSAGRRLAETPPATLLRLLAAIAAAPADPVPLAALLQHPLASLGHNPASAQKMHVTTVRVLREHDPVPRALHARIAVLTDKHVRSEHPRTQSALQVAVTILSRVSQALGQGQGEARDLLADEPANAAQWGARLRASFLAFIAGGDSRGWTRMEEEAIAGALDLLAAEGATSEPLAPADLPGLVDALLERRVRLGEDHPRLAIWSPLEARLQTHDLMILGGLTEDTWPEAARREPVLSRRMRARLGLTSPDQDRGLAAHDFFQFASLPRVVLTWCRRCKGRPAVMSGWLRRIETLATAIERDDLFRPAPDADPLALARRLDRPPGPPRPERAPAPKPPVEQRPRRFSASRVSTLIRDPFSIYARDILRIPSVGSFLRQPDVRETGTAVHSALEDWTHAGNFDALDDLEHRIAGQLASLGFPPMDVSERLSRMRPALVTIAARMRDDAREGWTFETEKSFERKIVVEGVEFTLSGVADRVDTFGGQFRIWDYKSGTPPTSNEVISGLEPQLPILGWLQRQQMGGTAPCAVIGYVHVGKPGRNKDTIQPVRRKGDKNQSAVDGPELLDRIEQDLMKVLAAYLDPNQPYLSKPRAKFANKYGDYDHLARRGEWAAGVSEDDDGGGGE